MNGRNSGSECSVSGAARGLLRVFDSRWISSLRRGGLGRPARRKPEPRQAPGGRFGHALHT
jgi:hypothetical protein